MKTILFRHTGALVRYDTGAAVLHVEDLNPELKTQWRMSRAEMLKFGWRCIRAALTR